VKASEDPVLEQGAEDLLSLLIDVKAKQANYFFEGLQICSYNKE